MAIVVAIWAASVVLKRMRANRASDQLVAAVVKQSKTEERPSAEALQLRERFEEAVATLKGKRKQRSQPLRPAVVCHRRRAGIGQDHGARQLGTELPARAAIGEGRAARRGRDAQLRLVVHR